MDVDLQNTFRDSFNESLRLVGQTVSINGTEVLATINDSTGTMKLGKGGFEEQEITEIVVFRNDYEENIAAIPQAQVTIVSGNTRYLLDGVKSNLATPYVTLECVKYRK